MASFWVLQIHVAAIFCYNAYPSSSRDVQAYNRDRIHFEAIVDDDACHVKVTG